MIITAFIDIPVVITLKDLIVGSIIARWLTVFKDGRAVIVDERT